MRRLRTKMIVMIALPTLAVYVAVLGVMMLKLRREAREDVEREMTQLASQLAARFDAAFREASSVAVTTARFMENSPRPSTEQVYAQLTANTQQNHAIYGAAMAFEPEAPDDKSVDLLCPYVYRGGDDDGAIERLNIGRATYDWYADPQWQWWHLPKRLAHGAWCDPYFDKGAGNVLMVTYGEPFTRDGRFAGVTTVDVMLPTLRSRLAADILGETKFAIVTRSGHFVFSSQDVDNIMRRTIFEQAEEQHRLDLAAVGRRMVAGESGTAVVSAWDFDEPTLAFFAPLKSPGWSFVARMTEREALAQANKRAAQATAALALTLALIIACISVAAALVTRPIAALREQVREIAGGNLDARVEAVRSRDEIGDLANSFNQMAGELGRNLERLSRERATREKMEHDLDIAREIQRGLLPTTPPNLPGFEVAGWNRAADKTGGDFFDWLELPNGRTAFTVADVTGHGIGPALIVAVCRAYMRASASTENARSEGEADAAALLAAAVRRVNDLLLEDMPAGRFVTALVGTIDAARHEMSLLSAGQAPIFFFEAATGVVHTWAADGMPLGIMPGLELDQPRVIRFAPGDALVTLTDGFFEWADADGKQFGIDRLAEFIRVHATLPPDALIERIFAEVVAASGGTEQADDLTALIIRRTPVA